MITLKTKTVVYKINIDKNKDGLNYHDHFSKHIDDIKNHDIYLNHLDNMKHHDHKDDDSNSIKMPKNNPPHSKSKNSTQIDPKSEKWFGFDLFSFFE